MRAVYGIAELVMDVVLQVFQNTSSLIDFLMLL